MFNLKAELKIKINIYLYSQCLEVMGVSWHRFHGSAERFNEVRAFKSKCLKIWGGVGEEPKELIKVLQVCQERAKQSRSFAL